MRRCYPAAATIRDLSPMLNRRYLGWLIAGAYVAPDGPYCRPDDLVLRRPAPTPQRNGHAAIILLSPHAATDAATDNNAGAPRC